MIKNIVSDLGGCLIICDFKYVVDGLAKYSLLSDEKILKIIERGNDFRDYQKGLISSEIFYRRMKEKINFEGSFETFKKIWMEQLFSVNKEYAKLCVDLLKRGYKIYCLSNINELHWKKISNNFCEMEIFHRCFLSYQMKKIKPFLEIYEEIIIKTEGLPHEFIMIDDKEENIKGAKKAGMHALLYDWKKHAEFAQMISKLLLKNSPILLKK
ncbi:MAG: HAD-IA family hydrolase [Candidatus Niyogibacteria bacterium]|nr:HAD-IA family hydrolase [Candidatus Niyogibacteria bacterium]